MKKYFVIILCLLMITGCGARERAKLKTSVSEYESEIASVRVEGIEFFGFSDNDFQKSINDNIAEDLNGAMISFDTMVSESTENIRLGNRCVLEIKQFLKNNDKNFISVIEEHYVYTGGAHGSVIWYPRNIDTLGNKIVTADDLFCEGYEKELNRHIDNIMEENKEEYSDLWEHPKAMKDMNFYISDGKLVVFFQPYELSYYARGFVEFPIKLCEIRGILKEEYKRLAE